MLGKDEFLEDKMTRAIAILPLIEGRKGILHLESVTDTVKTITFEEEVKEKTPEELAAEWTGGYEENGEYTGTGEFDENGTYVGPKPMTELEKALAEWTGGYDEEGDYTGAGEYDEYGNYVGPAPTEESLAAEKAAEDENVPAEETGDYTEENNSESWYTEEGYTEYSE